MATDQQVFCEDDRLQEAEDAEMGMSGKTLHDKASRKKLSMESREKIRALLQEGLTQRQIAKHMNVSSSVIWRFEKRLKETGGVEDRHKGRRPKKIRAPTEHWTDIGGERKYQCTHCQKTFVYFSQIHEHIRVHTGERPFKCDQCFKGFAQSSALKRHLISHSKERPFMCDFCAKCFADPASLRLHVRTHTGEKPYKCRFCERRCTTAGNLNAHMRVHRNQYDNECRAQVMRTEGNLTRMKMPERKEGMNENEWGIIQVGRDEEGMTNEDDVLGRGNEGKDDDDGDDDDDDKDSDGNDECVDESINPCIGRKEDMISVSREEDGMDMESREEEGIDAHEDREEGIGDHSHSKQLMHHGDYEMAPSGISDRSHQHLSKERETVSGMSEDVYQIKQEPQEMSAENTMYEESHEVQLKEPEVTFSVVPEPSETPHVKARRRRLSMDDREKVRALLQNGTSRQQVSRIMNVSFSVIWRFEKRLRDTGSVMDRHKGGRPKIVHKPSEHWTEIDGERRYQCNHCRKTFVHFAQVHEHIRVHTGEKPFKCDQCFKEFAQSSSLKRHLISHSDERPFMCDFCAKCFADPASLRLHVRTHTGEKPYKCRFCDRRCTTAGNLNAHTRVHRDQINEENMARMIMARMMMSEESVTKMDEMKASAAGDDDGVTQEDRKNQRNEGDLREEENGRDEEGARGRADDSMDEEENTGKGMSFCTETETQSCESDIEVVDRIQSTVRGQRIIDKASDIEIKQEPPDAEGVAEHYQ